MTAVRRVQWPELSRHTPSPGFPSSVSALLSTVKVRLTSGEAAGWAALGMKGYANEMARMEIIVNKK
jgi:hypothetical protein